MTTHDTSPISQLRFNALAGYCRHPMTHQFAEEVRWFQHAGERLLTAIVRDRFDNDFGGIILGRDRRGRFRWVGASAFHNTIRDAEALLHQESRKLSAAPDEEYYQGDESGESLKYFDPIVPIDRLNENFLALVSQEGFSPAREIIEPMMHWYEDLDGNFVEQAQTTGFDARLWELYLFATFVEIGYIIQNIHAVPDFSCIGSLGDFTVEAMTVNPTQDHQGTPVPPPPRNTPDQIRTYLREYMPIKYGSTLYSKLQKKYWEKEDARDKPLIFAIQDFSSTSSMSNTSSALPIYLYGYDHTWERDDNDDLRIIPKRVETHRWRNKEIPSGFFRLPGAENVSAVLFNASGTLSKFNRMGVLAHFGSRRVILIRHGFSVNVDPNSASPNVFRHVVNSPNYRESWVEGMNVFHNPNAKHAISPEMIPGAAHHMLLDDGQIESLTPDFQPFGSWTQILVVESEAEVDRFLRDCNQHETGSV